MKPVNRVGCCDEICSFVQIRAEPFDCRLLFAVLAVWVATVSAIVAQTAIREDFLRN
jgi:hypothetical protein